MRIIFRRNSIIATDNPLGTRAVNKGEPVEYDQAEADNLPPADHAGPEHRHYLQLWQALRSVTRCYPERALIVT